MSKKMFSDEDIIILRQNPFTFKATRHTLSFTNEFKEIFIAEYNTGKLPRQILSDHGYDPKMLGEKRMWGISQKIRKQYKNHGEVSGGTTVSKAIRPAMSDKEELKQLRHEVDYLKQEVEFLKKISSIRNTGK